jgi:hypothetical protein
VTAAPAAASPPGRPPVPALTWRSCAGGFQCATAQVPLDCRHPRGATISIAVIRHRATRPARRIGTLFFNGGGPSAQGANFPGSYILTGALPPPGTVCRQDASPFPLNTAKDNEGQRD